MLRLDLMGRARIGVAGVVLLVTSLALSEIALAGTPQDVTVQLSPTAIAADGSSTSDITGRVTDGTGAGLIGESVSLSISAPSGANIKFTPNPAMTGPNGDYAATLTSSTAPGQYVVVAADGLATIHPALLTLPAQSVISLAEVTDTTPPVTNQQVTLVATATAIQGGVAPRGTVTFENGAAPISGCSNVPTPTQSSASLSVTCATSFAAAGSPAELRAVYSPAPNALVTGSSSSWQTFPIAKDSALATSAPSTPARRWARRSLILCAYCHATLAQYRLQARCNSRRTDVRSAPAATRSSARRRPRCAR